MKKITITTTSVKMLADVHTPVGIYLRLRDKFRDTILLESTDSQHAENSYSFICINAIAGIEVTDTSSAEIKLPGERPVRQKLTTDLSSVVQDFIQRFEPAPVEEKIAATAQGLFGYTSYDAVGFFESVQLPNEVAAAPVPLVRYRLYQYVIAINHFKDIMYICENNIAGVDSDLALVQSLITSKDVPAFPFRCLGEETADITDDDYLQMVENGIAHCLRGDVFQIVLSRRFKQKFTGDDFNVYRTLRTINPSPYLFYFDYGDYKLMGSSPESQLLIKDGKAVIHPIAGTAKRSGYDEQDAVLATQLLNDQKESAEHVMLVDLARNDLSKTCTNVAVNFFKQVHYYSHVIHLVSEVTGTVPENANAYSLLGSVFPAGTLSGAPKFRAMQLINEIERTPRGFYGGCIGFLGFDGSCNHAIMIRTFLSKHNVLHYQAGAGVVAASVPANELQEVNNKLAALKQAIRSAENI